MASSQNRPQLAPGLRVVPRGREHLQIGLYDGRRVVLPRTEHVERTLTLLLEQQPLDESLATVHMLERLDRHGCLVWTGGQARPRAVSVIGRCADPGLPDVSDLLEAAALQVVSRLDAELVLVLSEGELDRSLLDPLVRSRTDHLVVRLVDGGAVLGPLVVPGATACLRCIDAHQSVRDPDHVAVTTRYVHATCRPRPDGVPDVDPALAAVALAWAVRDVAAHLAGREPSTWSRTLHFGEQPARRREWSWLRHPQCGCCWSPEASDLPMSIAPRTSHFGRAPL
jgi:bacteriocin biosynthesis cyclodehydratase domain-containing protein